MFTVLGTLLIKVAESKLENPWVFVELIQQAASDANEVEGNTVLKPFAVPKPYKRRKHLLTERNLRVLRPVLLLVEVKINCTICTNVF